MPTVLLPSSAAAFAPRSSPNVVLNSKVEPWLTAALKRVNRVKRPLNNVAQHTRCLTETLSSQNAIWTLCSMMFPKAPDAKLRKDENPLAEAIFNYQMIHIEAYVVHVDMVSQNEVAFKLTPETIEALVDFHRDVYCVDAAASTWEWSEKGKQLKKLQDEFNQAANKFVYRTNAHALEGLEEDGAGELLGGRSEEAKNAISNLFVRLLAPTPRTVDVLRPTPFLPGSTDPDTWWQDSVSQSVPQQPVAPLDSWKVLPSSPPTTTTTDTNTNLWAVCGLNDMQFPSPTPSYNQPFTTTAAPYNTAQYYPTTAATSAALPLPSMLVQPCSTAASMNTGFGWGGDRYQDFAMPMPYGTTMSRDRPQQPTEFGAPLLPRPPNPTEPWRSSESG